MYLSPAFSPRNASELEFLRSVNPKTGFSLFWIDIIRPLLEYCAARSLVEIGAWDGEHTSLLLEYCERVEGSLVVIEPEVRPSLKRRLERSKRVQLIPERSQDALPRVSEAVDAVLLEGDLNYHTVLGDLRQILAVNERCGAPFPVVFLRAVGWPYARRDMYYEPESLPRHAVHAWEKRGLSPWNMQLVDDMINAEYCNASSEGGERNGVLTAAEDFLKEAEGLLRLWTFPANHGLGIIYRTGSAATHYVASNLEVPRAVVRFLETWEIARLNDRIRRRIQGRGIRARLVQAARWPAKLLRSLARLVTPSGVGSGSR